MHISLNNAFIPGANSPQHTVFAHFKKKAAAVRAIDSLQKEGFSGTQISIEVSHNHNWLDEDQIRSTRAGTGAAFGSAFGLLIGGILGFLMHTEIFEQPLSSTIFMGSALGWAFFGVVGLLLGLFVTKFQKEDYKSKMPEGSLWVQIRSENPSAIAKARSVLISHGGEALSSLLNKTA
jgi:hypothetical protein